MNSTEIKSPIKIKRRQLCAFLLRKNCLLIICVSNVREPNTIPFCATNDHQSKYNHGAVAWPNVRQHVHMYHFSLPILHRSKRGPGLAELSVQSPEELDEHLHRSVQKLQKKEP